MNSRTRPRVIHRDKRSAVPAELFAYTVDKGYCVRRNMVESVQRDSAQRNDDARLYKIDLFLEIVTAVSDLGSARSRVVAALGLRVAKRSVSDKHVGTIQPRRCQQRLKVLSCNVAVERYFGVVCSEPSRGLTDEHYLRSKGSSCSGQNACTLVHPRATSAIRNFATQLVESSIRRHWTSGQQSPHLSLRRIEVRVKGNRGNNARIFLRFIAYKK